MRIGIIVDGDAEFASLPHLIVRTPSIHEILPHVLKAPVHPLGGPGKIARAVMPAVRILVANRGAHRIIVLLDREQQHGCCGELAGVIQNAIDVQCANEGIRAEIHVVLKDRMYENWLIADPAALRANPGRFRVTAKLVEQVEPNRADAADASKLMKVASIKRGYNKVDDSVRIMKRAEPMRMGANSRSFRRLLRLLGVAAYSDQSKRPR